MFTFDITNNYTYHYYQSIPSIYPLIHYRLESTFITVRNVSWELSAATTPRLEDWRDIAAKNPHEPVARILEIADRSEYESDED